METTQFSNFVEDFQNEQARFQTEMRARFKGLFELFWEANPRVKEVKWDQYAPYFNDGDACTFSVYEPNFTITSETPKDSERKAILSRLTDREIEVLGLVRDPEGKGGEIEGTWWELYDDPETKKYVDPDNLKALENFITSPPTENLLKSLFGEDCTVVATREGFSIQTCDHD